jgi:purine-binding chemotaxis protein CheW
MKREVVTFELNDQLVGIEVHEVREVIGSMPLTAIPLAGSAVAGLVNLRGEVLLAIDLKARLTGQTRRLDSSSANVILQSSHGPVCVVVDQIGEVVEVTDEQFEPPPSTLSGAARTLLNGAYKLPDRLLLTLDTETALNLVSTVTGDPSPSIGDPS